MRRKERITYLLSLAAAILAFIGLAGDLLEGVQARPIVWPLAIIFALSSYILRRSRIKNNL